MDTNIMKKMVVLKNIQSNMIEEAYIVFKNNVKVHRYETINKKEENSKKLSQDYMIKEAEMIIDDYISKAEQAKFLTEDLLVKRNYKRLKVMFFCLALFSVLSFILLIIK